MQKIRSWRGIALAGILSILGLLLVYPFGAVPVGLPFLSLGGILFAYAVMTEPNPAPLSGGGAEAKRISFQRFALVAIALFVLYLLAISLTLFLADTPS